jgi:broad specificity phosphatase PhoE
MKTSLAERFQEAYDTDGIRAAIEYLESVKKELDGLSSDVGRMIKTTQQLAVDQKVAAYVDDAPKELAPTKDEFITLFGREMFDKVKKLSKPKRIFTWLIK